MTNDEKTVGTFLNRLLDYLVEGVKTSETQQTSKSTTWPDYTDHRETPETDENAFICAADGDCPNRVWEEESEIREHIKEEHGVAAYEKVGLDEVSIGDGVEPFREDDGSEKSSWEHPEIRLSNLEKEERKDRVVDWFNDHCEKASTIPEIGEEVFGVENIRSGDREYNMLFKILDELKEEGFLNTVKDGPWNRYYSDNDQLEGVVIADGDGRVP